jgi:hypothetical protein
MFRALTCPSSGGMIYYVKALAIQFYFSLSVVIMATKTGLVLDLNTIVKVVHVDCWEK